MHTLYLWLYNLSDYFVAICRLPSMKQRLSFRSESFTISPSDEMEVEKWSDDLSDILLDEVKAMAEFSAGPVESEGRIIIRYFKTIVAWTHAVARLSQGKLFQSIPDLTFDICHEHVPLGIQELLSPDQLIQKIEPHLQPQLEKARMKEMIRTCLRRCRYFGAVHPEAIITGLTTACLSEIRELGVTEELVELLQGSNRIIGMGKKCCWTCYRLGEKLNRQHPDQPFQLPGTNGIVSAWTPPFGIPLSILDEINEELEVKLLEKLAKALQTLDAYRGAQYLSALDSKASNLITSLFP